MHILDIFCCLFVIAWSWVLPYIAHGLLYSNYRLPIKLTNSWWVNIAIKILCGSSFIALSTVILQSPLYALFLSGLWITVYTDFSAMLISRWTSLYAIPLGIAAAYCGMLSISVYDSMLACLLAAGFLTTVNHIFYKIKGHHGLGQGDIELFACIGAWTGLLGAWCSLLIGSTLGTLCTALFMIAHRKTVKMIPFGPFLAFGAIIYQYFYLQLQIFFL